MPPGLSQYLAEENAIVDVQAAMIGEDAASIQAEALAVDEELDQEPVGSVGQLLSANVDTVEHAKQQGGGHCPGIAFFKKTAARAEVAITDSEYGFLAIHLCRIEALLTNLPEVHEAPFPPSLYARISCKRLFSSVGRTLSAR